MTGEWVIGSITLPGQERSVARSRRFARDLLGSDHPSLDDIQTCVTEAFANGVLHTDSGRGGKVTVMLLASAGEIVAEVTDEGAGGARPRLCGASADLAHGRGMQIIDGLSREWGVRPDGDRTTVWMRFTGPPPRQN